jgi:hypothetical protein
MSKIYVDIKFTRALDQSFFAQIDSCFDRAGYFRGDFCKGFSARLREWADINWSERAGKVSQLIVLKCEYSYINKSADDTIWVEITCKREPLTLMLKSNYYFGYGAVFTKAEKAQVLRFEALCLDLHKVLEAEDTSAWTDFERAEGMEPWFHFSAKEWRPLGELPDDPDEHTYIWT